MPVGELLTTLPSGRAVAYGYNEPGRFAVLAGSKASQLFVFRAEAADYDRRDIASQRRFLERNLSGMGWRMPELLDATRRASEFYLDGLARSTMTSFTRGHVALVGDGATQTRSAALDWR